jgi:hypothetical protein
MPNMPKMPSFGAQNLASELSSPSSEESQKDSSVGEEIVKPTLTTHEASVANQFKMPMTSNKGIECVASRKGFYNQTRLREGDSFTLRSENEFGDWFKCVDKDLEKKRVEFIKMKKASK